MDREDQEVIWQESGGYMNPKYMNLKSGGYMTQILRFIWQELGGYMTKIRMFIWQGPGGYMTKIMMLIWQGSGGYMTRSEMLNDKDQ